MTEALPAPDRFHVIRSGIEQTIVERTPHVRRTLPPLVRGRSPTGYRIEAERGDGGQPDRFDYRANQWGTFQAELVVRSIDRGVQAYVLLDEVAIPFEEIAERVAYA